MMSSGNNLALILACILCLTLKLGSGAAIPEPESPINVIKISTSQENYVIIIDAGSTGSRLHIYKVDVNESASYEPAYFGFRVFGLLYCEFNDTGLNKFTKKYDLYAAFEPCIERAEDLIPSNYHANTPIFLLATAGMRLLEARDKSLSDQTLEWVRSYLKETKFLFENSNQVRIIAGWEEGAFGFLAVNYLFKRLSPSHLNENMENLTGNIQMGGASAQMTFPAHLENSLDKSKMHEVGVRDTKYSIYSHSYLCRGRTQTKSMYIAKLIRDSGYSKYVLEAACFPVGYEETLTGSSLISLECINGILFDSSYKFVLNTSLVDPRVNYTIVGSSYSYKCRKEVNDLLPNTLCPFGQSNCAIDGVYQPTIQNINFTATENIYGAIKPLKILFDVPLERDIYMYKTAVSHVCSINRYELIELREVKTAGLSDIKYSHLMNLCFRNTYVLQFLDKLGFKSLENLFPVGYDDLISDVNIDWPMGFLINAIRVVP